jgi:uroporphyrinogen decarboxylase
MNCLQIMKNIEADVIGIDWRINLSTARAELGEKIAVQGNLDPACLLGTRDGIGAQIQQALAANAGRPGHIFNLGHGVLPQTPVSNVEALVDILRSFHEK